MRVRQLRAPQRQQQEQRVLTRSTGVMLPVAVLARVVVLVRTRVRGLVHRRARQQAEMGRQHVIQASLKSGGRP